MPDRSSQEQGVTVLKETPPKKETRGRKAQVVEMLSRAAFNRNHSIPNAITSIDLGEIGNDMETMMQETETDSDNPDERRERGKLFYVTRGGLFRKSSVRTQIQETVGTETSFTSMHPEWNTKRERPSAQPHSHPVDNPPSPDDVNGLFGNTQIDLSAVLVITPKRKFAIFRGENAKTIPDDERKKIKKNWEEKFHSELETIPSFLSTEERNTAEQRIQDRLFTEYALEYGWIIFECVRGENIVHLKQTTASALP